jgi:hypothetical protein
MGHVGRRDNVVDIHGVKLQEDPDASSSSGGPPARHAGDLGAGALPADALAINVDGREITGPDEGFGQLWRKRYWIRLTGIDARPAHVVQEWRAHFGEFWPGTNHFYRPLQGLQPGEVAVSDLEMPAGTRLSTGIVVARVDPTSFTFLTTQGHTFAGQITFSAHDDAGTTVAQVEVLLRASDPLFEIGMPLGGHAREDEFWQGTLRNLAAHFGVAAEPEMRALRLDRGRHWGKATNIVYNSYLRTGIHMATRPLRSLARRLTSRGRHA